MNDCQRRQWRAILSAMDEPKFSSRSSYDLRKNALARALEVTPPELDLTESNPTRAGFTYPVAQILAALDNPAARSYEPDPRGLLPARAAIAARMRARGLPIDDAHVLLTSGTSEAYGFLFKLLCDPGDEVLIPEPSYPLFAHLCQLEQVRCVPYRLRYDGQWHLSLDELRAARGPRTRAVLVVNPNNPTGNFVSRAELSALEALELPIISDEVFTKYALADMRADARGGNSALASERALVFALFGLSKQAGLPQWKVSWLCARGPAAQVSEAMARLELIADTYLSVATPTQLALPRWLELMEPTQREIATRLRRNLAQLRAALQHDASSPVTLLDVQGGFYAVLQLPSVQSDERWVLDFLERDGVHVQPGYFFDFGDAGVYVVLSLLTREAVFDQGVQRILARVRSVSAG